MKRRGDPAPPLGSTGGQATDNNCLISDGLPATRLPPCPQSFLRMKSLTALYAALALTLTANAAVIPIDLSGTAGSGMLTGNQVPPVVGTGSGGEIGAGILYDDITNLLTINVGWGSGSGFTDLTGTVIAAHIHAASGPDFFTTNGAVIIDLDGATPGFNSSGTNGGWTNTQVTLTAAQETQLFAGQLYLNSHTEANPGGEIRGNLVLVPEPSTVALAATGILGLLLARRRKAE